MLNSACNDFLTSPRVLSLSLVLTTSVLLWLVITLTPLPQGITSDLPSCSLKPSWPLEPSIIKSRVGIVSTFIFLPSWIPVLFNIDILTPALSILLKNKDNDPLPITWKPSTNTGLPCTSLVTSTVLIFVVPINWACVAFQI